MENLKEGEPTFPTPIIVGSGPSGDQATEYFLSIVDWFFREEEFSLRFPVEGEISNWIERLWTKSIQSDRKVFPTNRKSAVIRELLRESFSSVADPGNEGEVDLAHLLNNISQEDIQKLGSALATGDPAEIHAVRSEMVEKLAREGMKELTPAQRSSSAMMAGRCRAGWASALCLLLHKSHPLNLIARARRGEAQAVLKLVKVDKLFLSDSCTIGVIRQAELSNNRGFLEQLAKAIAFKPKVRQKNGCRLYLHLVFALGAPLPSLVKLQLRLDPEGTRFRTFPAFEKFVERCRKDFHQIQSAPVPQNPERT